VEEDGIIVDDQVLIERKRAARNLHRRVDPVDAVRDFLDVRAAVCVGDQTLPPISEQ
jgi:hypothetical protein